MTALENRTLFLTCDRDGCGNRRAFAHGCAALELAEDKNAEKLRELAGRVGWGIEPGGFVECCECAGSEVPLDEPVAARFRREQTIIENKACLSDAEGF